MLPFLMDDDASGSCADSSPLEEAVLSETRLPNSLLAGKIQGILSVWASECGFWLAIGQQIQLLATQFPTHHAGLRLASASIAEHLLEIARQVLLEARTAAPADITIRPDEKTPACLYSGELPLGLPIEGESGKLGNIGVRVGHNDRAKMVAET